METEFDFAAALDKLRRVAAGVGVSMTEMAARVRDLAQEANEMTVMPGDTERAKYKTLQYTHEVMKN